MKFTSFLAGSLLLASVAAAQAANVGGVYNTGVDNSGNALADGARDSHYKVLGADTYVFSNPAYTTAPDAKYVSYSSNPNGNNPQGLTRYSTTFDLTGYNASTASLSGYVGADDGAIVYLNGNRIFTLSNPGFNVPLAQFATSQYFLSGVNTLSFDVNNDGAGPTGLIVSKLAVTAVAVPGPIAGAGLPVIVGLAGAWYARRRKRAA